MPIACLNCDKVAGAFVCSKECSDGIEKLIGNYKDNAIVAFRDSTMTKKLTKLADILQKSPNSKKYMYAVLEQVMDFLPQPNRESKDEVYLYNTIQLLYKKFLNIHEHTQIQGRNERGNFVINGETVPTIVESQVVRWLNDHHVPVSDNTIESILQYFQSKKGPNDRFSPQWTKKHEADLVRATQDSSIVTIFSDYVFDIFQDYPEILTIGLFLLAIFSFYIILNSVNSRYREMGVESTRWAAFKDLIRTKNVFRLALMLGTFVTVCFLTSGAIQVGKVIMYTGSLYGFLGGVVKSATTGDLADIPRGIVPGIIAVNSAATYALVHLTRVGQPTLNRASELLHDPPVNFDSEQLDDLKGYYLQGLLRDEEEGLSDEDKRGLRVTKWWFRWNATMPRDTVVGLINDIFTHSGVKVVTIDTLPQIRKDEDDGKILMSIDVKTVGVPKLNYHELTLEVFRSRSPRRPGQ
jgi:hypothetical protein